MKNFFGILAFFICQSVLCQEYTFDTFLEYNKSNGANDIFMLNSSSQDYVFYCYGNTDELKGRIVDHKRNIQHYYSLKNSNNAIEFKYLYSEKKEFKKKDCDEVKKKVFEIKNVVIDSLNQSYEIIEYTNKKRKRIYQNGFVGLKKIDKDLPSIVYGYFSHFSKCIHEIVSFPKGYIPTNIKITYFNGNEASVNLIQNKKINTLLSLKPEDIKYN